MDHSLTKVAYDLCSFVFGAARLEPQSLHIWSLQISIHLIRLKLGNNIIHIIGKLNRNSESAYSFTYNYFGKLVSSQL